MGQPLERQQPYRDGLAAMRDGKPGEAVRLLSGLLDEGFAGTARLHGNLSAAARAAGDLALAEAASRQALALEPQRGEFHANRGNLLRDLGDLEGAAVAYRRAARLMPEQAKAPFNLGTLLHEMLRLDEAAFWLERAWTASGGAMPEALLNLGRVREKQGRPAEAQACYEHLLSALPELVAARFNRSLLLLQAGRLAEGWREYQSRWQLRDHPPRPFPQPLWRGEPLAGRTLLVHAEQGLGDTLQFCRYLPMLAGGRIVFECQAPLLRLLRHALPGVTVVPAGEDPPAFDLHVPLLDLPWLLGTDSLAAIPAPIPYLTAAAPPPPEIAGAAGLRLGLVWAGSPGHNVHSVLRSIPLEAFAPLWDLPGVTVFSLQKGPAAAEAAASPRPLVDLDPRIADFADTAACIAGLDVVVTIDTSVAHLAGAMGKPVCILLRAWPDWRWFLDRGDSPWYPTAALFRQERIGEWWAVTEAVAGHLRAWMAGGPMRGTGS